LLEKLEYVSFDFTAKFLVLHMLGFDKILNYQLSIEKFCEKNPAIKTSKIYT